MSGSILSLSSARPSGSPAPNLRCSGRADWMLLDSYGYVVSVWNDTTAETETKEGHIIQITFEVADPPRLSYFCADTPYLDRVPFTRVPTIVWSVDDLALLRVIFPFHRLPSPDQYFVYRAGRPGRGPSLDLLPDITSFCGRGVLCSPGLLAVLPDGDGKDFVLAVIKCEGRQYTLDVFRSKRRAWTKELLVPELPSWLTSNGENVYPSKVIALRGGVLGYVDLWNGILLCDVLNEPATARFVPLPKVLPNNRNPKHYKESTALPIRDVARSTDGSTIRCVEMENLFRVTKGSPDATDKDVLLDSEADHPIAEPKEIVFDGWRLVTWYREISWDHWRKESTVHVNDLGDVSLPQLGDGAASAEKLPLNKLKKYGPMLCGDDVVCLMSKINHRDDVGYIVSVDMRNKAVVGELIPFNAKRSAHTNPTYIPCALSKYLNS